MKLMRLSRANLYCIVSACLMSDVTGLPWLEELTAQDDLGVTAVRPPPANAEPRNGVPLDEMKSLRIVNIGDNEISDAGLQHLHGNTSLRMLYMKRTKATDRGIAELRAALPECRVID